MFLDYLMFYQLFLLPQVKSSVVISHKNDKCYTQVASRVEDELILLRIGLFGVAH